MATEKRASTTRRASSRRTEPETPVPSMDEMRQLQILNDRICQVMEALRRLNEGARMPWPVEPRATATPPLPGASAHPMRTS